MKPRLVQRLQGSYKPAEFTGGNKSGVTPLGKKVLVLPDEFEATFAGGKLQHLPELIERMDSASESGVIVEMGEEAFSRHHDGSQWKGRKPHAGEHVYMEKYAGLLVMGNDAKKYRLMDDGCIGGIYMVEGPEE